MELQQAEISQSLAMFIILPPEWRRQIWQFWQRYQGLKKAFLSGYNPKLKLNSSEVHGTAITLHNCRGKQMTTNG